MNEEDIDEAWFSNKEKWRRIQSQIKLKKKKNRKTKRASKQKIFQKNGSNRKRNQYG